MTSHSELINFFEVEVIYLENGQYKARKHKYYPESEVPNIFKRTVLKLSQENVDALVILRDDRGMIKCERTK